MNLCPKCNRPPVAETNICHLSNPIGACEFGLRGVMHKHFWCGCTYSWVEVNESVDRLSIGPGFVDRGVSA